MSRYDHSACLDGAHDRDAHGQPDEQRRDAENQLLCNHCGAPLMYCHTVNDYDHVDPTTPGCFLVPDSNHVALVDMTEIAALVREQGIDAYVEHTGGGIWTIYAGSRIGERVAVLAGPSTSTPDTRHMGDPTDFYVGPDDNGLLPVSSVSRRGVTTPQQIAALIVTLVRETEKHRDEQNSCVICAATFDESSELADEWTFHWDHPDGTEIVAESCNADHARHVEQMRGEDGVLRVWDAARPDPATVRVPVATSNPKAPPSVSNYDDADTVPGTSVDTPVFHATVQALATDQRAADATVDSIPGPTFAVQHAGTNTNLGTANDFGTATDPGTALGGIAPRPDSPEDTHDAADVDWVDQWYGDPSAPTPALDPDSPEGAAILSLFRRVKDIAKGDSNWPGADVLNALTNWFTELGIDPDEQPVTAGRRLRLALRERPGSGLASSEYGVRINTDHDDPEPVIRTALHVLARQLGPGSSIELISHDRDLLTRIERPNEVPMAGS